MISYGLCHRVACKYANVGTCRSGENRPLEAWFEQSFGERVSILAGYHDFNSEFDVTPSAAELLNSLDREESKNILMKMEERNPELSNAIRKKMFGFADLVRLEQKDLQRIMREVDTSDLVLALKTATPLLNDAICGAISKRAAETLKEELEMLGTVRLKDVEAAQDRIIQIVRRLEEQEEISLEKGGAGVVN